MILTASIWPPSVAKWSGELLLNLFLAPVTRALICKVKVNGFGEVITPHLVHSEHRLQHIDGALLGSEMGKGVAILGCGGNQAGTVLQEELDEVGVVVLGRQVDWLLVQVIVRVDHCLEIANFREGYINEELDILFEG